jgi:hypothetical protein
MKKVQKNCKFHSNFIVCILMLLHRMAKEIRGSASQQAVLEQLQEDKNVLLGLYNKLLSEHAEVCLAYDEPSQKCKGVGLSFPDLTGG